jgi:hypothetical protein
VLALFRWILAAFNNRQIPQATAINPTIQSARRFRRERIAISDGGAWGSMVFWRGRLISDQ